MNSRYGAERGGCTKRSFGAVLMISAPLALLLSGCVTGGSVGRLLPNMGTMYVAEHYFGAPASSQPLAGGGMRHEWLLDRDVLEPPQYEVRRVYVGHDRDGFPVYEDVEFYVPERLVHQYCRIRVTADREGRILDTSMEGPSCEKLLKVPTTY